MGEVCLSIDIPPLQLDCARLPPGSGLFSCPRQGVTTIGAFLMAAPHDPETNRNALSSSLLDAHTGREFAMLRFALGLSLRRVATEFGCAPDFLSRRERDVG